MRTAFLILLAANLVYFVWSQWMAPNPAAAGSIAPRLPTIALASEAPPPAQPPRCIAIGPYAKSEDVSRAGRQLESGGYQPSVRVGQGAVTTGYSVVATAIDSAAKAAAALKRLRRAGFSDAAPRMGSGRGMGVLIGNYPDLASARAAVMQAGHVGVAADVLEVARTGTQYWLEFNLKKDSTATPEALQASLVSGGETLRVEACNPARTSQ